MCIHQVQNDKRLQEATLLPLGEYQDLEEAGVCVCYTTGSSRWWGWSLGEALL